jgi:hypothetical protein
MWKLETTRNAGLLILTLCGHIEWEMLSELQKILEQEAEGQKVVLDLKAVKLVDREVIEFLAQCETNGLRLDNCPPYVREWINRDKGGNGARPLPRTGRRAE